MFRLIIHLPIEERCVSVCEAVWIVALLYFNNCFGGGCWPGGSVGIATDYGLDGPGIKSRWGRDFPPVQTGPGAHPASCEMGTGSFPGVKCSRGVLLTTHPLLAQRPWKSRFIPLPPTGPQPDLQWGYFTFTSTKTCIFYVCDYWRHFIAVRFNNIDLSSLRKVIAPKHVAVN